MPRAGVDDATGFARARAGIDTAGIERWEPRLRPARRARVRRLGNPFEVAGQRFDIGEDFEELRLGLGEGFRRAAGHTACIF